MYSVPMTPGDILWNHSVGFFSHFCHPSEYQASWESNS